MWVATPVEPDARAQDLGVRMARGAGDDHLLRELDIRIRRLDDRVAELANRERAFQRIELWHERSVRLQLVTYEQFDDRATAIRLLLARIVNRGICVRGSRRG